MSLVIPRFDRSAVSRAADAEIVGGSSAKVRLLVDSSATGGALSTVRVTLGKGAATTAPPRCSTARWRVTSTLGHRDYPGRTGRLLCYRRSAGDAACVLNPACRECRPLDRTGRGAIRVLRPTHSYRARRGATGKSARCAGSLRHLPPKQSRMGGRARITHSRTACRCQRRRREFVRREIANPLLGSWISSSPSGIARWLSGRAGRLPRSSVAASTGWREFARREIG